MGAVDQETMWDAVLRPCHLSTPELISVASARKGSQSGTPLECGRTALCEIAVDLDERAVLHIHRGLVDVIGLAALGVVHQLIRAMDQFRRQLPRDAAPLRDWTEVKTHDADIDADRPRHQPPIVAAPVVSFDCALEAIGNFNCLCTTRQVRDQKTELVATEPGVKIASVSPSPFERKKVLGPDLIRKNASDAFDDPIANRMTERVVVKLEAVDIDDADAAPPHALFD